MKKKKKNNWSALFHRIPTKPFQYNKTNDCEMSSLDLTEKQSHEIKSKRTNIKITPTPTI